MVSTRQLQVPFVMRTELPLELAKAERLESEPQENRVNEFDRFEQFMGQLAMFTLLSGKRF